MSASALRALAGGKVRPELLAQLNDEVGSVEAELSLQVDSGITLVREVCTHTLAAGGKRLRPAFVSLAAKAAGGSDPARARKLGACMEMIHMATLMHDDVIDHAPTRRGRETASARFGNTAAILCGDVLLAKAMMVLAEDGDLAIIRTTSKMVKEMAEGEVRELETRGDFDLSAEQHLNILQLKTASFIACCCEVGGLVAGAAPEVIEDLRVYGEQIGLAFQIVDDLLDYRGDRAEMGKQQATDFREGCATLPLIFLREALSEPESQMARRKFGNGVTDDEIRMIGDWMETRGAFARAEDLARQHAERALEALLRLPETSARDLMETVAHYVLARQS